MLVYRLNKQIDGGKLLQDIQKLVSKNNQENKELLLVIKIQEVNYINDSNILRIEHKNLDN